MTGRGEGRDLVSGVKTVAGLDAMAVSVGRLFQWTIVREGGGGGGGQFENLQYATGSLPEWIAMSWGSSKSWLAWTAGAVPCVHNDDSEVLMEFKEVIQSVFSLHSVLEGWPAEGLDHQVHTFRY